MSTDLAKLVAADRAHCNRSIYTQLFYSPPTPTTSFRNRVVIVTGANSGLGLYASKNFARLGAAKVIMACRSLSKGEAARSEIEEQLASAGTPVAKGVLDVWALELASNTSVKDFAKRASDELPRLDHVILNASVAMTDFKLVEGQETTITVNLINTFLLAFLLLPVLRKSAKLATEKKLVNAPLLPSLSIVGSGVHVMADLSEGSAERILDTMSTKETANMQERYPASKRLQLMAVREMAARMPLSSDPVGARSNVVLNIIDPGLNQTQLSRNLSGLYFLVLSLLKLVFAWHPEVGSSGLLHGAVAGPESHGALISRNSIWNDFVGHAVQSEEGQRVQKKVWAELVERLERIQPGVTDI